MKSCRVFIKANYIKKAKDDWVLCEAIILNYDKLSVLKLVSINADNKVDDTGTIKRFNSTANGLKVLLNLSEFKSSEIKAINFRNSERFALKLVPSGILHNKKLMIVPEDEDDLTKLCSALSQNLQKSKEDDRKSVAKNIEVQNGTLKNHNNHSVSILKFKKEDNVPSKSPPTAAEITEEVYFSMDDNDVYDGNSLENSYTVCIEETLDSKKLDLKGSFILRLKEEGLELADVKMGEIVHKFPYIFIRRFGAKNDILRLEAGRKCTTGEGYLMFRFKDAQQAVESIRELVKELKNSVAHSDKTDQSNVDTSRRNSVSLSINSSNVEFTNDTLVKKSNWSETMSPISSPGQNGSGRKGFFPQESTSKSIPPAISPKPTVNIAVSPLTLNKPAKQVNYPVYTAINTARNGHQPSPMRPNLSNSSRNAVTLNRPPVVNNNFPRSNQMAASFSCQRPTQVNIPVIKDDSYCPKVNTMEVYDNMPRYDRRDNDRGRYMSPQNGGSPSRVMYSSSYSMQGAPLAVHQDGNYDNVPNNSQRCIQELETMLHDLGIPSR